MVPANVAASRVGEDFGVPFKLTGYELLLNRSRVDANKLNPVNVAAKSCMTQNSHRKQELGQVITVKTNPCRSTGFTVLKLESQVR